DAYTYGDQFFNDKPTEEDSGKPNMENKVESIVTVLIHQTSSLVLPLSTTVIVLTPSMSPIDDVPTHDEVHFSDSEGIGTAHLPKVKTKAEWLKPVPEGERPKTPKSNGVVPVNDLPEHENNWANSLSNTYKDLEEYKLLWKMGDIGSFIKWYCRQIRKKKLGKVNLEGPTFKIVKAFHDYNISLEFQMEECHWLLTNQFDLVNPEGQIVVPDMSKPLPLGGPPGQVTIQTQYFFNKDLEYLVSGEKGRRTALSISMLKAA
nr:hypothetical protein [Tanacetum cinerariifolium]